MKNRKESIGYIGTDKAGKEYEFPLGTVEFMNALLLDGDIARYRAVIFIEEMDPLDGWVVTGYEELKK